jgi:outer membrane protein
MRRKYLAIAVLVALTQFARGQAARLTLNECIETALKNNITVKQTELLSKAAEINYRQAKNNMLPNVQSSFSYSLNNGRSIDNASNTYINQQLKLSDANAQASLPVFSGFQLKNTIKQNELAFSGAKMEWQQRKDELTLQVILAYLQVLSGEDATALAKQQAELTKQQVERINVIAKEGATLPGNVSDLKGQYAGDQVNLISAENNYQSSVLSLTQLMMVPYSEQLQFDRTGLMDEVKAFAAVPDEIYTLALQTMASIKATDYRVSSSATAVKVARSNFYPAVSLFAGASTNYSNNSKLFNLSDSGMLRMEEANCRYWLSNMITWVRPSVIPASLKTISPLALV